MLEVPAKKFRISILWRVQIPDSTDRPDQGVKLNTLTRQSFRRLLPITALLLGSAALAQQTQTINVGDLNSSYNRNIWWMSIAVIVMAILIFAGVSYALF